MIAMLRSSIGCPGAAPGGKVLHHGLHAIKAFGKDRVGGFGGLEFLPQRAQVAADVGGQKPEDAVGGGAFGIQHRGRSVGCAVRGMDRRVAGVDFDQIMQDQHADHAVDLHAGARLIGQHQRIKRQMPGMFARVFGARAVADGGGAQHGLQAVGLVQKGQLPGQTVCHVCWAARWRVSAKPRSGGASHNR
jgi:hypothetical protein